MNRRRLWGYERWTCPMMLAGGLCESCRRHMKLRRLWERLTSGLRIQRHRPMGNVW